MRDTYNISINTPPPPVAPEAAGSSAGAAVRGGITPQNLGLLGQVVMGGFADGNFDANDVAALKAVSGAVFGGNHAAPAASAGAMSDADFLKAVNGIAGQSDPGIGPGERMMKKEAQRLVDGGGSAEDKKAFLAEADKLLNNNGANHDGAQDINEEDDHEGTRLAGFTDALLADDASSSVSNRGTGGANALISDFIGKAYADNQLSDTELQGLQALLGSVASSEASSSDTTESTSSANDGARGAYQSTASSSYSYDDVVRSMIYANMEHNSINQQSGELALSYINGDEDA